MPPNIYTVAEAAPILKVSENWLRDKARRREIPCTMIGGSYHFTDAHLEEIIRLFERPAVTGSRPRAPARPAPEAPAEETGPVLRARPPRRRRQPPG